MNNIKAENSILLRVIDVLTYSKMSKNAFAKKINMEQTTVNNQLLGKRGVSIDLISNILKNFEQISPEWLINGEGSMFKTQRIGNHFHLEATPKGINLSRNTLYENRLEDLMIQRIKEFIQYLGISNEEFSKITRIPEDSLKDILNRNTNAKVSILQSIAESFDTISLEWLLTGKGSMLKPEEPITIANVDTMEGGIPYYADLPVSAGQLDTFIQDAEPTGWVKLPGVKSKALFPVIGCSMKPEINPGDVVGIVQLDSWEMVDPDKVYLIITHDERMIKHLALDEEDNSILWCISPNYPKFKINKSDIKFLYRISFCGKLM